MRASHSHMLELLIDLTSIKAIFKWDEFKQKNQIDSAGCGP